MWPRQKYGGEEGLGNMRHTVRRIHWSFAVPDGQRQIMFLFIAHTFARLVGCCIVLVAILCGLWLLGGGNFGLRSNTAVEFERF